jgi:hypothetical protein
MTHKYFSLSLGMFLLMTLAVFSQAQTNTCRLTYSLVDKKSGTLSSINLLQTFSFDAKDEEITKLVKEDETGIKILVGARIYGDSTKTSNSKQIEVAIAFGDSESRDLFRYADSAIAESIYDKKTKWISVSKTIETKDEIYRFRFGCSRDK